MKIIIVGAGGGGCWLAQALVRFIPSYRKLIEEILLVDGDKIEQRNLDRQLFTPDQVGQSKAVALRDNLEVDCVNANTEWFMDGRVLEPNTLVFACADNHPARVAVLNSVDSGDRCSAIILGNELVEADAYVYFPEWRDTALDPRVYYPELLTDRSGDPVRPEGCQGEAQEAKPQLAMANMAAASSALYLFYAWFIEERNHEIAQFMPVRHMTNQWGFRTTSRKQFEAGEK